MNIIDTWVTYPMDDSSKKFAYGVLVVITIVLFFAFIFTREWDYFHICFFNDLCKYHNSNIKYSHYLCSCPSYRCSFCGSRFKI